MQQMAIVTRYSIGYEFSGLSLVGMRLVNEFQRQYPQLCEPSLYPNFRFIRFGKPEQNCLLEKLVDNVRAGDPEMALSPSRRRPYVTRD
jgi:hypothetical protein